uniref:MFS domain-containing protein n=1 Tax=Ascaris lumbricoides TaxID=6252 RepID=A0A0M3ICB6_ASCLU
THFEWQTSVRSIVGWHLYYRRDFSVAANCVTYSLVFNLTIIGGSLYVNTALSGVLRYAIGIAIAIIDYMCVCAGRKIIHAGSMAVIVACLAGIVSLLHYELADIHGNLIRIFTLISFGMTGSIFTQAIISPDVPYLLLTVISVTEILAILWGIPETKNKHLSDVLYERDYESRELNEDRNTSTKAGNVGSKSVARAIRPHTFVRYEKI